MIEEINTFTDLLNQVIDTDKDTSTVTVLPAQCGSGKSSSISYVIYRMLHTWNGAVLVVTDRIDRLGEYLDGNNVPQYMMDYFSDKSNLICTLTAQNIKEEIARKHKVPILLMSTQRFFSLSRDEVQAITDKYVPKRAIIIDERAPLSETIEISYAEFSSVDEIMNAQLDNLTDQNNKEWLITQWKALTERYRLIMKSYENSHTTDKEVWKYSDDNHSATEDDERFTHLVFDTYRDKLNVRLNPKNPYSNLGCIKAIQAILKIVYEDAIFVSERKNKKSPETKYSNKFYVELDHSDLVTNLGAKSIILDATGGIDPTYNKPYVKVVDCSKLDRPLPELTLHLVNINTSKSKLLKYDGSPNDKTIAPIKLYIGSHLKYDAIFTHKAIEECFLDMFSMPEQERASHVGHFGALTGRNEFREMTDIVQVGLNRYPSENYLSLAHENKMLRIGNGLTVYNPAGAANLAMLHSLLADIIQNVYRTAIRNADNTAPVNYWLIYRCMPEVDQNGVDANDLSDLAPMIKEEFERLGAHVVFHETPDEIKTAKTMGRKSKTGEPTNAQKVLTWIETQPPGRTFKPVTLYNECGLTKKNFDKVKERNKHIVTMLEAMRTDRPGWYMIPDQKTA